MADFDGNLPLLGMKQEKVRTQPAFVVSFVRSLDENGQFEPETTFLNAGQVQAIAGRSNICSAEDLVDMIGDMVRRIVREELKLAKS